MFIPHLDVVHTPLVKGHIMSSYMLIVLLMTNIPAPASTSTLAMFAWLCWQAKCKALLPKQECLQSLIRNSFCLHGIELTHSITFSTSPSPIACRETLSHFCYSISMTEQLSMLLILTNYWFVQMCINAARCPKGLWYEAWFCPQPFYSDTTRQCKHNIHTDRAYW